MIYFMKNTKVMINAHFEKDKRTDLKVEFRFFENLCLAWV